MTLDLDDNGFSDISTLGNLTEIMYLNLSGNKIADISPLANLEKLSYLTLTDNLIANVNPIAALAERATVDLSNNKIVDVSPFAKLKELRTLRVTNNLISDFSSLAKNKKLKELVFEGNPITEIPVWMQKFVPEKTEPTYLEKVKKGFPANIHFPTFIEKIIAWEEAQTDRTWLGGRFEMNTIGHAYVESFIDKEEIQQLFAPFGHTGDNYPYCIWQQEDGRQPVVFFGQTSGAKVIAKDIESFFVLVALGYQEVGYEDLTTTPDNELYMNENFQAWIQETLQITLPINGKAIEDEAVQTFGNLDAWLRTRCIWDFHH